MKDLAALLAGDVVAAARGLLGRRLRSEIAGVVCEVMLTELEAYGGPDDPASHAFGGPTARNASMFGPAGTLYVYRSYGVHWCMNAVTGPAGRASAVLLRAGRPLAGEEHMRRRRGRADHLGDGPGRLSQALGVTGEQDGASLFDGPVRLLGEPPAGGRVESGPRVGITRAAGRPWRFRLIVPGG
ncbi:MAG TPA: DNA-3-methyladenine glycosylase [Acidimicrobiia bacterium]|nr:DNA-3-methyladenine glycosylase [Acidimicrobiia bacterium]